MRWSWLFGEQTVQTKLSRMAKLGQQRATKGTMKHIAP